MTALWVLGNVVFTLLVGLITVYGVMLLGQSIGLFRRHLEHKRIPFTTIGEAPEVGLIKLNARVAQAPELIAPLSGASCVFWWVTAWVWNTKGGSEDRVLRQLAGDPLTIEDETGQAQVQMQMDAVELDIKLDVDTGSRAPTPEGGRLRRLLVDQGVATQEQVEERNFTARERHLAASDRVHLLGPATRKEGTLWLAPDDRGRQVLVTDRPGRILSERFFGKAVLKLGFGGILTVGSGYGIIAMWMA